MAATKGQNWQNVQEAALPVIAKAARTDDETIIAALDQGHDQPVRMYGAATPDSKLYFSSSRPLAGNGSAKMLPAIDDKMPVTVAGYIDFSDATTSGPTFQTEGGSFTVPGGTTGHYRRMVVALRSTGEINVKFSSGDAVFANLTAPETLANGLDGQFRGYVDLQHTGTSTYKTADSLTSVIENAVSGTAKIVNVAGGGSGGGANLPMRLQSITSSTATISGGTGRFFDSNEEMANYDGAGTTEADFAKPQSINLSTILGGSPANGTTYYLYWDRNTFSAAINLTDSQGLRAIVPITQSNYVLLTTPPTQVNRARYVYRATIRSADSGSQWTGTGASFSSAAIDVGSVAPVSVSPVVYHGSQAVGSVGSASQLVAGHVISTKSWPSTLGATKRAWWGLAAASGTDGSGNSKTLTAEGAPTTAVGILGVAGQATTLDGTTQSMGSTDSFFNPGNGKSFAMGGWFKATDWTNGTGTLALMAQEQSSTDRGFGIFMKTNGDIEVTATNSASAIDADLVISNPGFVDGTWHHIVMVYDFSTTTLKAYLDGVMAGSMTLANVRSVTSPQFRIGAQRGTANAFFAGSIDECFFVNDALLSDTDVRKLYAARLDHSKDVTPANQQWSVKATDSQGCLQPVQGAIVCQGDKDSLFVDFGSLSSTTVVDLALQDLGISATVVPAGKPFDATYSSAPSFPISHGLGDVPVLIGMQEVASGLWQPISLQGVLKVTSSEIQEASTGDFATAFGALSGSARIRLIAFLGAAGVPTPVLDANASRGGTLSSSEQSIPGLKKFLGGIARIGNVRASEGSAVILTDADNRHQVFSPSADFNVQLPTTGIKAGDVWLIENRSASFQITLAASNGTQLLTANSANMDTRLFNGYVMVCALQDAPTTPAHWRVEDLVIHQYVHATLWDGNSTATESASANIALSKRGYWVTAYIAAFTVTPTAGTNNALNAVTSLPVAFRPSASQRFSVAAILDNGTTDTTNIGQFLVQSGGQVTLRRNVGGSAFTNGAGAGLDTATQITWYAGP